MAAYERRSFSETAVDTKLNGGMTDSSPTFTLEDSAGWPTGSSGDFIARIENEDIRCASRSGVTVTIQTGGRGVNGTAAAWHTSGVDVQHVFTATPDADEANYAVAQTVGQIATAGDQLVGSALNALAKIPKGTSGQYWKQGASLPAWATLAAADVIDIDERIADTAGGMFTGNTETGITATYQDTDNTVDLVVSIDSTFVTDFGEAVADAAGAMFTGNTETGIVATYQDADNTVDLEVGVDGSTLEISSNQLRVKDAGITAAKLALALPQGVLGYSARTTDSGTVSNLTDIDISSLAVTVTVGASRRIRITQHTMWVQTSSANPIGTVATKEGATQLGQSNFSIPGNGYNATVESSVIETPSAGSHTYKIAAHTDSASSSMLLSAAATYPSFILVEDIGAA